MYWPDFLKAPFRKPGGVFGVGMGALAVIFGVVAFKLVGLAVLLAAFLVLLVIETWRDAAKRARERDAIAHRAVAAEDERALAEAELEALREEVPAGEALQVRVGELESETAALRSQLASPTPTPEQLIVTISNQLMFVELTVRHREIQEASGAGPWPVVRVSLADDGFALVYAYTSQGPSNLGEEVVALQDESIPGFQAFGQIMVAGDRNITARFDLRILPPSLAQRLDEEGDCNPHGLTLTLAGVVTEPYRHMDDTELDALRDRLVAVTDTMSQAIVVPRGHLEPQELES